MLALIAYYWIWLLVAFIIGLATAWWAWADRPRTVAKVPTASVENDRIIWSDGSDNAPATPQLVVEEQIASVDEDLSVGTPIVTPLTLADEPLDLDTKLPEPALPDVTIPPVAMPQVTIPPIVTPVPEAPERIVPEPIAPEFTVPEPAVAAPLPPLPLVTPAAIDDLTVIKGIGPQLSTLLSSLGVSSFGEIANWGPADIERIDSHLGVFRGRIIRDEWVQQAKLLAAGDIAGFTHRYGEL